MRSTRGRRGFTLAAAGRAQADWYTFVLQELNGLGTMLRFQNEAEGAPAAATQARVAEVLATLAWDDAAALRQTWAAAQQPLEAAEDAWGLYVVLQALEPDQKRVQDWLARLGPESRAVIAHTPSVPTTAVSEGEPE